MIAIALKRRFGRLLKSESSALSGAVIKTIANVINRSGAFLLIPFLTAYLSPSEYGVVNIITTLSGVASLFSISFFVSYQANYHRLGSESKEIKDYAYTFTIAQLVIFSLLIAVSIAPSGKVIFGTFIPSQIHPSTFIILFPAILGLTQAISSTSEAYLNMERKFLYSATISIASFMASTTATIAFILYMKDKPEARILGLLIGAIVSLAFTIPFAHRIFPGKFRIGFLKDALRIGLPLTVNGAIFYILNSGDRFLIAKFIDLHGVGIYGLAFSISSAITVISSALSTTYCAEFYALTAKKDASSLTTLTWDYLLIMLSTAVLSAAWMPTAVHWFLNDRFKEGASLIPLQCGGLGLYLLFSMLSQRYNYEKKTIWIPLYTVATAAIAFSLNFVLLPRIGLIASPISLFASYLFLAVSSLFVSFALFEKIPLKLRPSLLLIFGYSSIIFILSYCWESDYLGFLAKGCATFITIAILAGRFANRMWRRGNR